VMQREIDAIIAETLDCFDDGAIEDEELSAFGLVLELFNHAIVERRAALQIDTLQPRGVQNSKSAVRNQGCLAGGLQLATTALQLMILHSNPSGFVKNRLPGRRDPISQFSDQV